MTSTAAIRTALAGLWDTGANAYELAQAVMQAADLENGDIEFEVESVIARALLAREFVDLSKVAEEVAKVLPGGMRLELEIGKTYKNREGDKVTIIDRRHHGTGPFKGNDDCQYQPDGSFGYHETDHGFDLVEECEADAAEVPKPEALPLCEAILAELWNKSEGTDSGYAAIAIDDAQDIIRKHFAALTVGEVMNVIEIHCRWSEYEDRFNAAQAVMRLLRRG